MALLVVPPTQYGCGPWFPVAIFSYSTHPDLPLKDYARGQLGILQPTYWRKYLYIAYRNLSGLGFTPAEIKILTSEYPEEGVRSSAEMQKVQTPARTWLETRNQIPNLPLPRYIQSFRTQVPGYGENFWEYFGYENCLANSFETAWKTLQRRIQQFGIASSEVRSWVEAQDKVFGHCGGWWATKNMDAPMPEEAKTTDHPLIRADRAYQMAAANFYAKKFDVSQAGFEKIAADEASPWRGIAPLLVARCLIRKATLTAPAGQSEAEALKLAQAQLESIIRDPMQSEHHASATGLLGFVQAKLNPGERLREIAGNLMRRDIQSTIKQDLIDFTFLLDKGTAVGEGLEADTSYEKQLARARATKYEELSALRTGHDMLDWVLSFQAPGDSALKHSVELWRKTGAQPWLVAALTKERAGNPEVAELLAAAEKIPPDSPAYISVTFHRLRLLAEEGKPGAARTQLDDLLARRGARLSRSTLNLLLALRMKLAQDLNEFLRFAPRVPATTSYNEDGSEAPGTAESFGFAGARGARWNELLAGKSAFDSDAAVALSEKLPLRLLSQSVRSTVLPAGLRRELAVAAWVKANLLENDSIAAELTPALAELAPELKGNLGSYQAAQTPDSRRFAAVFAILHLPGMRPQIVSGIGRDVPYAKIDSYRDNWWCAVVPQKDQWYGTDYERGSALSRPLKFLYPENELRLPAFLNREEQALVEQEWSRQRVLPPAPNYMSTIVLEWAKKNPDDPRVPEALHLAVRSTRYGCTNNETSKYSKAAFKLLHQNYPKSEWTQKTKFWF